MIGNGDGGAVAVRRGLPGSDAVQDLLGESAIQGQNAGGTPIVEIVQVVEPRVQIIRRLQIEIVGHEGRGIDRAGAVLADGRYLAILVHDREPLPALGQDGVIHSNAHISSSSHSVLLMGTLVFKRQDIDLSAVCGASVQRDHPGAVVGTEVRVRPELGTFVFIPRVAVGTMPVAAEDRLFFCAGLRCVHPVTPPRPAPFLGCGLAPIGAVAVTAVALLNAGNPAVHENIMRGLIIVYHRRDDLAIIGCVLCRLGEIEITDDGQPRVIACQLQGGSVGPVALVVPDRQAFVDRDHFLVEIFMIPTDQDHGVLIQKGEDEALHLHGFLPAVEEIAQDDQLVRLRIGEIPRLIQRFM